MAKKDVLLYGGISTWNTEYVLARINEVESSGSFNLRINSTGGDVFAGWGLAAKIREKGDKITLIVDGLAASMAAILLPFANNVEALFSSKIMIHKAAFPSELTNPSADQINLLNSINENIKSAFNHKIDNAKLKELKGITIDELFALEARFDLWLTADEALQIGLISKVNSLGDQDIEAFLNMQIAANYVEPKKQQPLLKTMTKDQLKTEHPAVYAEILAQGVAQENDRVSAFLVYNDLDPVGVKAGIESGLPISAKAQAEFMRKEAQVSLTAQLNAPENQIAPIAQAAVITPNASTQNTSTSADDWFEEWKNSRKKA